jgi:outer membrane lipoprotein-sorting protein
MRTTVGFVISLILAVATLMVLLDSNHESSTRRRMESHLSSLPSFLRRKLWNYSNYSSQKQQNSNSGGNNKNSNSNYSNKNGNNYNKNYNNNNNSNNYNNNKSGQSQYANNYANYNDNSGNNNNGNYDNQNYDNYNYIWQRDDDDNYKNDDASYYNSNSNYKASGSYNGRNQYWGGQSVQSYNDDLEPQVTVTGMDDDEQHWKFFSRLGRLSAKETAAVSVLAAVFSLFLLFLLGVGWNIADICQLYCCCGIFRHDGRDHSKVEDKEDPIVDGFVKLGDF